MAHDGDGVLEHRAASMRVWDADPVSERERSLGLSKPLGGQGEADTLRRRRTRAGPGLWRRTLSRGASGAHRLRVRRPRRQIHSDTEANRNNAPIPGCGRGSDWIRGVERGTGTLGCSTFWQVRLRALTRIRLASAQACEARGSLAVSTPSLRESVNYCGQVTNSPPASVGSCLGWRPSKADAQRRIGSGSTYAGNRREVPSAPAKTGHRGPAGQSSRGRTSWAKRSIASSALSSFSGTKSSVKCSTPISM